MVKAVSKHSRYFQKEGVDMVIKGYWNHVGYMGWVEYIGDYMLFSCESDYIEYLKEVMK